MRDHPGHFCAWSWRKERPTDGIVLARHQIPSCRSVLVAIVFIVCFTYHSNLNRLRRQRPAWPACNYTTRFKSALFTALLKTALFKTHMTQMWGLYAGPGRKGRQRGLS